MTNSINYFHSARVNKTCWVSIHIYFLTKLGICIKRYSTLVDSSSSSKNNSNLKWSVVLVRILISMQVPFRRLMMIFTTKCITCFILWNHSISMKINCNLGTEYYNFIGFSSKYYFVLINLVNFNKWFQMRILQEYSKGSILCKWSII